MDENFLYKISLSWDVDGIKSQRFTPLIFILSIQEGWAEKAEIGDSS